MQKILILTTVWLLSATSQLGAQVSPPSAPPAFDHGTIATGFYINQCLGFSYPIPEGWVVNSDVLGTAPGIAKHQPGGGLILLVVDQHTSRPFFNRMVLSATNASAMTLDTPAFVSGFVHAPINNDQLGTRKILKEAFAIDLGGKHFFRTDFTDVRSEATLYKTYLSTKFRGYFLSWTIVTGSAEELETAANSLQKLVFYQDQADPNCPMPTDPAPAPTLSAASAPTPEETKRMRISQGVSQTLLLKKVQPAYPVVARQNGVEGSVVLRVTIDTAGIVENVAVVSGDPLLAPSAIAAVKQWKYKPYVLNDKPVKVETQVTVIFALQKK
jgi:TonB family protein